MDNKTELKIILEDVSKLSEIIDFLIQREIDNGADNLKYIANMSGALCVSTQTLVKFIEKCNNDI